MKVKMIVVVMTYGYKILSESIIKIQTKGTFTQTGLHGWYFISFS